MKKFLLILVMLSTALLAYNQSSRRTTNANNTTRSERNSSRDNVTASNRSSNRTTVNQRSPRTTNSRTVTTRQTSTDRSAQRSSAHRTSENRHNNKHGYHRNHRTNNNHGHHRTYENRSSHRHSSNHGHVHNKHYGHHRTHSVRVHHTYRSPVHVDIVWNANMHHHYVKMYPSHRNWRYHYGYRIATIPAYDAEYFVGEIKNVYGRVSSVYYSHETDEFYLNIGRNYPYQYFTVIIPGRIARNECRNPRRYYLNRDIKITGLISLYDGKPEIIVKRNFQLDVF